MMQGDSYGLLIDVVKDEDGSTVTPDDVIDVEISIGFLTKQYSKGEIFFDYESGKWIFPVTQEESFKMPASRVEWQVRVMWLNGVVAGDHRGYVKINESISRRVL